MGWKDRFDILKWIKKICRDYRNCKIVLYGISMGAATVMMSSGEKLPNNVKICIEDCGYSSVFREFKLLLRTIKPCIADFILKASNLITKIRLGFYYEEASSIEQIKKSKIPTLFIHGSNDTFVDFKMLDEIYSTAKEPKKKLVIEGAGHANCSKINPEMYWKTVKTFIKENI